MRRARARHRRDQKIVAEEILAAELPGFRVVGIVEISEENSLCVAGAEGRGLIRGDVGLRVAAVGSRSVPDLLIDARRAAGRWRRIAADRFTRSWATLGMGGLPEGRTDDSLAS